MVNDGRENKWMEVAEMPENKGKTRGKEEVEKTQKKGILWSDTLVDHKIRFKFSEFLCRYEMFEGRVYSCHKECCNLYYFSLSSSWMRSCVGSRVPLLCFMACPTRKERAFVLPFL